MSTVAKFPAFGRFRVTEFPTFVVTVPQGDGGRGPGRHAVVGAGRRLLPAIGLTSNALFHVIQMLALPLIYQGVRDCGAREA